MSRNALKEAAEAVVDLAHADGEAIAVIYTLEGRLCISTNIEKEKMPTLFAAVLEMEDVEEERVLLPKAGTRQ